MGCGPFWLVVPPTSEELEELLAAHGAGSDYMIRRAQRGVRYYGPGDMWAPPPVPTVEQLDAAADWHARRAAAIRRRAAPAPIVRGLKGPSPQQGSGQGSGSGSEEQPEELRLYWTPERLDRVRAGFRAAGLPEVRPGVFRWRQ